MSRPALLSPRRYLRSGYGLALPQDFTLSTLRTTIARAQNEVDRYCNVPKLPQAFDWRGGQMTDERHQWKLANPLAYGPGVKRVYLNAGPLKDVSSFIIDLGKTYRVTFDPASALYLNPMEQYLEIVAIAPTIIGVWPLGVALGLYNPISRTTYSYGWSFPVSGDVLEAESPTVYSAAYGNWDASITPVVSFDGTPVGNYTVDYDDGVITFDTEAHAPGVGITVTADYTYLPPSPVVDAIGLTTTYLLAQARIAQRGMTGLSSLRIAEVAMTMLNPNQIRARNGASIPIEAADLVESFVFGSAQA